MKMLALVAALASLGALAQSSQPEESKSQSSTKTLEGCLLREGPDFFLQSTGGNSTLVHLSTTASQELSQFVGQRVRVSGSDQPLSAKPPATSGANQPVTPVEKQPPPSTVPSGTPDPKVPVTQLPQSAQAGEGTEGFRGNATNRELYVSSVEAIASSCKPAATRKKP